MTHGKKSSMRKSHRQHLVSSVDSLSCGKVEIRADQNTGGELLEFSGRTVMHRKSRVSSAVKYDCFKLDDSGNCIIRKTRLHCI